MGVFKPHGINVARLPLGDLQPEHLAAALSIWRAWCGTRTAPQWRDVDLVAFPPELVSLMTVVDVIDGGQDYRYRYWGSQLTELFGREETGTLLSKHSVAQSGDIRNEQFDAVVHEIAPVLYRTTFMRAEGLAVQKTNLRLPVCDTPDAVTKIISLCTITPNVLNFGDDLAEYMEDVPARAVC